MSEPLATILRRPLTRGCWQDTLYALISFVTGVVGFTVVVSAWSTAAGLAILILGLPLAVLLGYLDRWWCRFERARAARILRRPVAAPYVSPWGEGRISRWLSVLSDRQTWFDALWMLASFPLGLVSFVLTVSAWAAVVALFATPIYGWSIPGWIHSNDVAVSIIAPFLGVPAAVLAAWLVRGCALVHARVAAFMLGPNRTDVLEQRVQTLAETRAGAVDAAATELQRVERDLHDGAQARLVALAMDLGLAEQRLAHADPDTAMEHVAAARGQAQAAMAELRNLVRGIGPSILHDRGLDAALTALASGGDPPVDLNVDVSSTEVAAVETAAYFVVAEALTNARKHARATHISVHVWENGNKQMLVEVVDDGVGGADPESGSGLAGLRKRVAALDGTLTVSSPGGGPTTVRAELPCE